MQVADQDKLWRSKLDESEKEWADGRRQLEADHHAELDRVKQQQAELLRARLSSHRDELNQAGGRYMHLCDSHAFHLTTQCCRDQCFLFSRSIG